MRMKASSDCVKVNIFANGGQDHCSKKTPAKTLLSVSAQPSFDTAGGHLSWRTGTVLFSIDFNRVIKQSQQPHDKSREEKVRIDPCLESKFQ